MISFTIKNDKSKGDTRPHPLNSVQGQSQNSGGALGRRGQWAILQGRKGQLGAEEGSVCKAGEQMTQKIPQLLGAAALIVSSASE